jgi:hypothetical protein
LSEAALERAQSASSEAVEEKLNNIAEKRVSYEVWRRYAKERVYCCSELQIFSWQLPPIMYLGRTTLVWERGSQELDIGRLHMGLSLLEE